MDSSTADLGVPRHDVNKAGKCLYAILKACKDLAFPELKKNLEIY